MKRIEICVYMSYSHSCRRCHCWMSLVPTFRFSSNSCFFFDSRIYSRRHSRNVCQFTGMHLLWKRFVTMKIDDIRIENKLFASTLLFSLSKIRCLRFNFRHFPSQFTLISGFLSLQSRNKIFSIHFKFRFFFLFFSFCLRLRRMFAIPFDCFVSEDADECKHFAYEMQI